MCHPLRPVHHDIARHSVHTPACTDGRRHTWHPAAALGTGTRDLMARRPGTGPNHGYITNNLKCILFYFLNKAH